MASVKMRLGAAGGGVALLLSVLLMISAWSMPAEAQTKVRTGSMPVISYVPIFAAVDLGYFKEQNIEIELLPFASGAKQMAPLAAGSLDVAAGGASAGLFNAIASGSNFKIVADKGQNRAGKSYSNQLVLRNAVLDRVKAGGLKALKGETFALFAQGGISDFGFYYEMKHAGLDWKEVRIVRLSPPKLYQAMISGAIVGGSVAEPWGARVEVEGIGVRYVMAADVPEIAEMQVAVVMYGGDFMTKQRDLAQRWMSAYLKGVRFYNERGMLDDTIVQMLQKYTKVGREVLAKAIPMYLDNNGRVNIKSIQQQIDWNVMVGNLEKPIDARTIVDESFLPKS
ncbi:MAG: ABC transporter substrate-binding protein [Candidatus Tectomicrobia bacterium]|nr:ABC transporter substrate-binding protein [Candidatus Tectomicrobia bacterium]